MLNSARNRKSVVTLVGLARPTMLVFAVLFAHQFMGSTARSAILRYYNIAYITNRGENMIELNVSTSKRREVRSVHFHCRLRIEFKEVVTFFLWMWPRMSNGLPSYVAGIDKDPRKKLYHPWSKAMNMNVDGEYDYLDIEIIEPFYRQFGQFRCQANGITRAHSYVKFVSAPFYVSEQWFAAQFN